MYRYLPGKYHKTTNNRDALLRNWRDANLVVAGGLGKTKFRAKVFEVLTPHAYAKRSGRLGTIFFPSDIPQGLSSSKGVGS